MSPAEELLDTLRAEEAALRARDFPAIEALSAKKDTLAASLDRLTDTAMADAIQQQASQNTRLFEVLRAALASAQDRLRKIDRSLGAVGYNQDGERLTSNHQNPSRRV